MDPLHFGPAIVAMVVQPLYNLVPNALDRYRLLPEEARKDFPSLRNLEKQVWKLEDAEGKVDRSRRRSRQSGQASGHQGGPASIQRSVWW